MNTNIETIFASPQDDRDYIYAPTKVSAVSPVVDLIPQVHEVEHQGGTNSCTANAGCTALEILYSRAGNWNDFSRMYLYYYTRKLGGLPSSDNGAYPKDICRALAAHGVPHEKDWPFTTVNIGRPPTSEIQKQAKEFEIEEYRKVDANIDDIRNAVLNGLPVLTTMKTRQGVYSLRGDWRTHTWDSRAKNNGSHEVVIVGFCDKSKKFLTQNSWGKGWGDGGFFGIPYDKVGSGKDVNEFWVITDPGFEVVPFEDAEILGADYYDPSDYVDTYVPPRKDYSIYNTVKPKPVEPKEIKPIPQPIVKPVVKKNNYSLYVIAGAVIAVILFFALT